MAAIIPMVFATVSVADVRLPAIIGDHMVIQRDRSAAIWGWGDKDETITVEAGTSQIPTAAGRDGNWRVMLPPMPIQAKPIEITIHGHNSITLHDVLVGDVWLCSGQSNMEFPLSSANNAQEAIAAANHPDIRLFVVQHQVAFEPREDCKGQWIACSPDSVKDFSAVGYFFADAIRNSEHVPMGMIGSYWGGTPIESWISFEGFAVDPELKGMQDYFLRLKAELPKRQAKHDEWYQSTGKAYEAALAKHPATRPILALPEPTLPYNPYFPTVLFNGMIKPIIPYTLKGEIWYQGESNSSAALKYRKLLPALIGDMRSRWNQGDFPFGIVQLANYSPVQKKSDPAISNWALLREAQSLTAANVPNTVIAVIVDIGQSNNIHPRDKIDVGRRLAIAVRKTAYGETNLVSSPTYDSMQVDGDRIHVHFKDVGTGLKIGAAPSTQPSLPASLPVDRLMGFVISGDDHQFVPADAMVEKPDTVVVSSPRVVHPVAVRYGWENSPTVNLYNDELLPASPFRTDNWPDLSGR